MSLTLMGHSTTTHKVFSFFLSFFFFSFFSLLNKLIFLCRALMKMFDTILNHVLMSPKCLDFIFQGQIRALFSVILIFVLLFSIIVLRLRFFNIFLIFFFLSYRDTTWGSPIVISMDDYYKILSDLKSIVALQDENEKELKEQIAAGLFICFMLCYVMLCSLKTNFI